jgi:hypothetical protein
MQSADYSGSVLITILRTQPGHSMNEPQLPDIKMDASQLYREEVFTDRQIGTIRRLTPVDHDGQHDTGRDILYSGETQVMTPGGALPLNFELEADNLGDAAEKFGAEAQVALERTIKQIEEMRREQASSIVVPGQGGGMGGMGGVPGGGFQL